MNTPSKIPLIIILSLFLIGTVVGIIILIIVYSHNESKSKPKHSNAFSYVCSPNLGCHEVNQAPGPGRYSNYQSCMSACGGSGPSPSPHSSPTPHPNPSPPHSSPTPHPSPSPPHSSPTPHPSPSPPHSSPTPHPSPSPPHSSPTPHPSPSPPHSSPTPHPSPSPTPTPSSVPRYSQEILEILEDGSGSKKIGTGIKTYNEKIIYDPTNPSNTTTIFNQNPDIVPALEGSHRPFTRTCDPNKTAYFKYAPKNDPNKTYEVMCAVAPQSNKQNINYDGVF